jgi:hypothetical protein
MDDRVAKVSDVLHRAAETHHAVFGITDGVDQDWATWYSDWLVNLSELPDLLGAKPTRSELTHKLVQLDKEYSEQQPDEHWEDHYAKALLAHFAH